MRSGCTPKECPEEAAVALCSAPKGDAKVHEENVDYRGEPTYEAVTA